MLISLLELSQQHLYQHCQVWIVNSQETDYVCLTCCAQQLIKHVMKIDSSCVLMVINFAKSILISYSDYILKGKTTLSVYYTINPNAFEKKTKI